MGNEQQHTEIVAALVELLSLPIRYDPDQRHADYDARFRKLSLALQLSLLFNDRPAFTEAVDLWMKLGEPI